MASSTIRAGSRNGQSSHNAHVGQETHDELRSRIGAAGYRWTTQRQAVLDVLRETDTHLDADQIYQMARRRDPRLSLSTVYRTLHVLRERGIVRELRLGEGHHHYEFGMPEGAAGTGAALRPYHSHLVCRGCRAVVEFQSPLLDRLMRDLQRRYRFHLGAPDLEVTGTCQECLISGGRRG